MILRNMKKEQLLTISTIIDIVKEWMCLEAHDNPNPPAGTDARGSSLKAISHFMPNKKNGWDEVILQGNLAKSREMLDLLKVVRKRKFDSNKVLLAW